MYSSSEILNEQARGCRGVRLENAVEFEVTVTLNNCDGFQQPGNTRYDDQSKDNQCSAWYIRVHLRHVGPTTLQGTFPFDVGMVGVKRALM